jgi:hypothetical protein
MDANRRLRFSAVMLKDARYLFELAAECFGRAHSAVDEGTRNDYLASGFCLLARAEAIRDRAIAVLGRPLRPEPPSLLRPSDSRTIH